MNKIAIASIALCSVMLAGAATAGPIAPVGLASQSLVQQAHHWHHGWHGPGVGIYIGPGYGYGYGYGYGGCRGVRHLCADRWGWGGPGFRRCVWRHGC